MWQRIVGIIIKELLASVRDRRTRWVVLVSPPFLLLIYAFAITQDVRNVSIAVFDQDSGLIARELIARFEGSPTFAAVHHLNSAAEIAPELESERAALVLQFGVDFSRRITAGEPARVQVLLDGRRSNTAQILLGYTARIVERFNAELLAAHRTPAPASVLVTRSWFNANLAALPSAVPKLVAVLTAVIGFMVSALAIARERELGTLEQLLISPLHPLEILIGKTLPALLIALGSASVMVLFGWLFLGVPVRGSLSLLFAATIVYLAAIIGIGLFISSLCKTQQQAIMGLFLYMVPATLLSGFATPVANMPDWLQLVAWSGPITHFLVISSGIFLKNVPADTVLAHLWPMLAIAAFTLGAGTWLFRRRVIV